MRRLFFAALSIAILATPAWAAQTAGSAYHWDAWRNLPVQDGGRRKPLDTLGWETLRMLSNRGSIEDPETGEKLDPVAFYLAMVFEWQGWDEKGDPHGMMMADPRADYFGSHGPDKWDNAPLLRLDYLKLREALGIPADQKHVSPAVLSKAEITDPQTGKKTSFLDWAEKLAANKDQQGLTTFEKKGLELAGKYWTYQDHRVGQRLEVLPLEGSADEEWLPVAFLMRASFGDSTDPGGKMRKTQTAFRKARQAYLAGDPAEFNLWSARFVTACESLGPKLGHYPDASKIDMEVAYNHWAPFRFGWVFLLFAFLGVLLNMGSRWRIFYMGAIGFYAAGMVAMLIGFAMRVTISGRAPVTNMYESIVYVGMGIAVFGLVFELIYRRRYILAAASAVATVALILADNCPMLLDPSLRPLQPVLRSNFWLTTHVLTITASYAAFALALGIANITLGFFLAGSKNREAIGALSRFTYRVLQVGVLLLAVGTILGGVWADYAWGRFWGWDPKEVWALIALLGYLALLHARYVGWVGQFGLAASAVGCFSLVVVAWYGVNFVLGAGLHSYGFGGGGKIYVGSALLLQFLYVGAAALAYRRTKRRKPVVTPGDPKPHVARTPSNRTEQLVP